MNTFQKAGGLAALAHAFAYLVGIVIAVTLIFPVLDADTSGYIEFVSGQPVPDAYLDPDLLLGISHNRSGHGIGAV